MSGLRRVNSYRIAGAIEAGYLLDGMYVEVIADGKHLPADLLELVYKVKGPDRICLVTDSMRAAGMPPGRYKLGNIGTGMDTVVEDSVAKLPDRLSFAGSVATADRLVRTMRDLSGAPLPAAVAMMSLTPARLLGLDRRKGSIAVGKDADLVIFDEEVNIHMVMVRGEIIPPD
jgi:N-acetylglucosamine-6-phosphate deacetylase